MKLLFENWRKYLNSNVLDEAFPVPPAFFRHISKNIKPKKVHGEDDEEEAENENVFPYQIYCDMDGVLVDLVGGVLEHSNRDPQNKALRAGITKILKMGWKWTEKNPKFQQALDYINDLVSNNVDFWATLPPMPDKDKLWNYISQYDPIILSHPWDEASEEGKRIWVENNLVPSPKDEKYTGKKYIYAANEDGSPNLLIDDFEQYITPWRKPGGGKAILHKTADQTINKLQKIHRNKT